MLRMNLPALLLGAALAGPALAQTMPPHVVNHAPSAVTPGTYVVEPRHTRVIFSLSHMGFTTWYGEFLNAGGTLVLDPKNPSASTLEIHIPVNTVTTTNTVLDGELKSAMWLDATKYPEITFKSTKVVPTGPSKADVTGDLTFHGVTKPITLAVVFNGSGNNMMSKKYTVGFEVSGHLKRSEFGVKTGVPVIGDDITLTISAGFEHG